MSHPAVRAGLAGFALTAGAACGGGSGGELPPTALPPAVAARLELTPAASALLVDSAVTLTARVLTADGALVSAAAVTWRHTSVDVGSVDGDGPRAYYRAAAAGIDPVVASTSAAGSIVADTALVTVRRPVPKVASVQFPAEVLYVGVGASAALPAAALGTDGATIADAAVIYRVLPAGVATVTADGQVTGQHAGAARLVAEIVDAEPGAARVADTLRLEVAGGADARARL